MSGDCLYLVWASEPKVWFSNKKGSGTLTLFLYPILRHSQVYTTTALLKIMKWMTILRETKVLREKELTFGVSL